MVAVEASCWGRLSGNCLVGSYCNETYDRGVVSCLVVGLAVFVSKLEGLSPSRETTPNEAYDRGFDFGSVQAFRRPVAVVKRSE